MNGLSGFAQELHDLLGAEDFLRLVETRGGLRVYVPDGTKSDLVDDVGEAATARLAGPHAGTYIAVPLAREFRARHYRTAEGLSNAQIARRLGISERGVERLFSRMSRPPKKGRRRTAVDPRQTDLFAHG